MKRAIYVTTDNRKEVDVRCTGLVKLLPIPENQLVNVKNIDGELWLKLPMPDPELLPGSYDDESAGTVHWVFGDGIVHAHLPTVADYKNTLETARGNYPKYLPKEDAVSTPEEVQTALSVFFAFDMV